MVSKQVRNIVRTVVATCWKDASFAANAWTNSKRGIILTISFLHLALYMRTRRSRKLSIVKNQVRNTYPLFRAMTCESQAMISSSSSRRVAACKQIL